MVNLTEDLFYLAGALRDGSVHYDKASRNYTVVWYSKDQNYLTKRIVKKLARLGKVATVYEYKKGQYRVKIGSRELYDAIKTTFQFPDEGIGQVEWGASQKLRNTRKELKYAYMRGMFDAEGDVSVRNRYLEVSQKNTEILEWIKEELQKSDIHSGGIVLADRASSTYKIVVSKKHSVRLFKKKVGFEMERKRRMLARLCLD